MDSTFLVFLLGATLIHKSSIAQGPIAFTDTGILIGNRDRIVFIDEFLGVPYAIPPTGPRRFKKPDPLPRSIYVRHVKQNKPGCPQFPSVPSPTVPANEQSEDCLYLNIWSPINFSRKKPVMFWLHGGGFAMGGNRLEVYNAKGLAADGQVIVVTVNYRLNVFGFLYSGTSDAPGNVCLHDVLLALKWVRNNIDAFGGDPDNITIFGQSAGSIIVGTFAVSPLARGLYRRAIMESGASTYLEGNNITRNAMLSQEIAKKMNCADDVNTIFSNPSGVVSCLRNTDAQQLAKTTALLLPKLLRVFQPQFGDDIVPKNSRQAVIDGDIYDTGLIIGVNTGEGSVTLIRGLPEVFGLYGEKNTLFNKSYAKYLLRDKLLLDNPEPVIDYYLGPVPDNDVEEIRQQSYIALGHKIYVCPSIFFAERFAGRGNRVFFYLYDHMSSRPRFAPWMGVTHLSEVPFVLGQPLFNSMNYTRDEALLSRYMIRKWSDFAKIGHPGTEWPLYVKENPLVLKIDSPESQLYDAMLQPTNCDVFRPYFGFEN